MLEWNGDPCIDTLGIPCGSKSLITVVFLVADEIINSVMICSASASSLTPRDASGVEVDVSLPILWFP